MNPLFLIPFLVSQPVAPPLTLPETVTGRPGQFIVVQATTELTSVGWVAKDDDRLSVFPAGMLNNTKATVVVATQPGNYRLIAFGATKEGAIVGPIYCWIVVKDQNSPNDVTPEPTPQPRPPPGPTPGPGPTPQPPPEPPPAPLPEEAKGPIDVVIIEETNQPQTWPMSRTKYLQDPVIASTFPVANAPGKNRLLVVDKDVKEVDPADPKHQKKITPPSLVPYLAMAQGKPLPYIVVVHQVNGRTYFQGPLSDPAVKTPAALAALVHKNGG